MKFKDKQGKMAEIRMTGLNGIDWETNFYNATALPYDEESDTYTVNDISYLLEQARDYCRHDGDFADLAPIYDEEDATAVYVDDRLYCEEEVKERQFTSHEFTCYTDLMAWLDSRKDDNREAYYYGFMENFSGVLYTIADISHDVCPEWFNDNQTATIYEEARA